MCQIGQSPFSGKTCNRTLCTWNTCFKAVKKRWSYNKRTISTWNICFKVVNTHWKQSNVLTLSCLIFSSWTTSNEDLVDLRVWSTLHPSTALVSSNCVLYQMQNANKHAMSLQKLLNSLRLIILRMKRVIFKSIENAKTKVYCHKETKMWRQIKTKQELLSLENITMEKK